MNITYDEILELENFDQFKSDEIVLILGIIFETGRENQNPSEIKKGLMLSDKLNLDDFSIHEKMVFHYNVANGWSYLQILTQEIDSDEFWAFEYEELEKQIINLRLALNLSYYVEDDFHQCQIATNLGNLLSHLGRFSEAQTYWQFAIGIAPSFPMAIGNIGFGLANYAKILYDDGQQSLFLKLAYKYLNEAVNTDIYKEAKDSFRSIIASLETRFNKNELSEIPPLDNFSIGDTKAEKEYRFWCLNNHLFLNPLNDVLTENIAAHDCLLLPTITLQLNDPPVFQTIFNQIKQEYVTARYFLYESMNIKKGHFSDKGNLQMDMLDYSIYSFGSEKTKIAFRVCYSILDKIGYLLNDYLKLGFKPDRVSFRKIWYDYNSKGKLIGLSKKVTSTQNWAFRGLYWLSKDLYEKDLSFLTSIEPDSKELALLRNFIEHKSFKIAELGYSRLVDNDLTYLIEREEFEDKTLKLFKLVRASMIYLSLGINIEEQRKDVVSPVIPVDFIGIKDENKL